MNITILDNREIIIKTSDTFGTQNENKATVFNFSFPESLINANKKIVFITDDGVYWDLITNNSYKITNAVTKYKTVSAYVWLVDVEKDIDFRSKSWKITFNQNEEPDDVVPTEEEISGFDTMIAQLNTAIAEVDNIDIDAEKVGDTAIVTITNKQGTQKSVEIKDGSDYVITEDDYREIANIVEADLPENYYNKTETNNLLDGKVDKETGKSLIETSKIEKLDGIETGAEVNIVEDIKVNGTSLEVEEKSVNIPVPTELKDLTDDSTHRTVTDTEKNTWNNKADMSDIPDVSGFITKDVNNLTNYTLKTATGSLIDLEINSSNYVVSLSLKDIDGNVISTDNIDLPLESVVVGGSYDATNKKIVLTLENGNTVDIPVGDLIAGLQTEITSQNKLASDLVDDSNSGNKFVNTSEKQAWNAKYDKPAGGIPKTDLASSVGASLDKADSAIQATDLADYVKNTDYASSSKAGVIKVGRGSNILPSGTIYANHYNYSGYQSMDSSFFISKGTLEDAIAGKNLETANNKVTEIDENSTDTEYPSAKLLYDELAEKQEQIDGLVTENALLKDQIPNGTAEGTTVQITDSSNLPIEDGVIKGNTSQGLPDGYQQVDYIESTGTQWIDTGVKTSNSMKIIAKAINTFSKSDASRPYGGGLLGARKSSSESNFSYVTGSLNDFVGTGSDYSQITKNTNTSMLNIEYDNSSIEITCGNYSYSNDNLSISIADAYNIYLFALNQQNTVQSLGTFKLYSCKIWNNNSLVRDMIPCYRKSDNVAGLYDTVNGVFYTNQGTGTFSIGDVAPNPNNKLDIHTVTGDCEVEVVNANIWDEEWEIGGINNDTGELEPVSNFIRTKNYISIEFNTTYYRTPSNESARIFFYTKEKNYISNLTIENIGGTFTTPNNAKYMLFKQYGTTYNNDIAIIKGNSGTYTPHAHQTFPISLGTIELCKIGNYQDYLFKNVRTLRSGRANPLFNADLDEGAWYKHAEIGKVILDGSESGWEVNANGGVSNTYAYYKNFSQIKKDFTNAYCISDYFSYYSGTSYMPINQFTIGGVTTSKNGNVQFNVGDTENKLADFKIWLSSNNVEFIFPLETPTYTKITDTALIAQLEAYYNSSTYRNVTNIITAGEDLAPIAGIVYKKDLTTLFNRLDSLEARVDLLE